MLTTNEIHLLNQTREFYYSLDWTYGEAFDSCVLDAMTTPGISFLECIASAKDDTDAYYQAQEQASEPIHETPHYDA